MAARGKIPASRLRLCIHPVVLAALAAFSLPAPAMGQQILRVRVEVRGDRAEVAVGPQVWLRLYGEGAGQRAKEVARKLEDALAASPPAQAVKVEAQGKKTAAVVVGGVRVISVDRDVARSHKSEPTALARQWAGRLRALLAGGYVVVQPARRLDVPLGERRLLRIFGPAAGRAEVSVQDEGIAQVVPGARQGVWVRGLATGDTAVVVKTATAVVHLPVRVRPLAAAVPERVRVIMTATPTESQWRRWAEYALLCAMRAGPGAVVEVAGDPPWPAGRVTVRASGPELFAVSRQLAVAAAMRTVVLREPAHVLVSNEPERVRVSRVLMREVLGAGESVRVLWHHVNASPQPLWFGLRLHNTSSSPVVIFLSDAIAGPVRDELYAGHVACRDYLLAVRRRAGVVLTLRPKSRVELCSVRAGRGTVVSGLATLQVVNGAGLVAEVAAHSDPPTAASRPISLHDRFSRLTPFRFRGQISVERSYAVGGPWLFIPLGKVPRRNRHGRLLRGNYGVLYQLKVELRNTTAETTRVELALRASGGAARASFLIDGKLAETGVLPPGAEATVYSWVLPPAAERKVRILTIPQAGSNYPIHLIVRRASRRGGPLGRAGALRGEPQPPPNHAADSRRGALGGGQGGGLAMPQQGRGVAMPRIGDVPRPEHPRPDFNRGTVEGRDWVCLNGWWQFEFDPDGKGERRGWHRGRGQFPRRIRVPFPWQSHAAWGTEQQAGNDNWLSKQAFLEPEKVSLRPRNYADAPQYEIGWYRREVSVPGQWLQAGKRVYLNIGAADWHVDVWVNGQHVGGADSGYLPVSFDITDALGEAGKALVVIRVEDPMDHSRQPVGKQYGWYTRTSGIWQTVWLEPRSATHISSLRLYPDRATGVIRVEAAVAVGEEALRARASVRVSLAGQSLAAAHASLGDLAVGQGRFEVAVRVPAVREWSPETPVLYDVAVALDYNRPDGTRGHDEVNTYCGFRDVTVGPLYHGGPKCICINGRPVYLRGVLDQSFNPWGVYSFATDEEIHREILQAKEAGFNFIRLHIKIEDPRWYYWCDREGILVMQDIPNFGYNGWSPEALERWERTLRGAIERNFNHPSIIAWCLFNETWGLGGQDYKRMPDRQQWVEKMYYLAKRLDPTRLVEDNSVCLGDHVITDINSWHFYINDYEKAARHIEEVVKNTFPGSNHYYVPGRFQRDEPLMNSEYGGISAGMGDMDVSWAFRMLTNELRRYEKICGYVYTELTDVEWERNGFYNYDRTPKEFGYNPRLLQGEQFVGTSGPPGRTVRAGERVTLKWWLRGPAPSRRVRLVVRAQRWNPLAEMDAEWTDSKPIDDWALATLAENDLTLPGELTDRPGLVWVWLELIDADGAVLAGNFAVVEVLGALDDSRIQVLDLGAVRDAGCDGEVERGVYDGRVELLAGEGEAFFEFALTPPPGARGMTLVAELSSRRPGPGIPQTDADTWPSEISIKLAGEEVARKVVSNQYADARGALSHMHGFAGRYGEPVTVELTAEELGKAIGRAGGGELVLQLEVPADAKWKGGLTIYGPRAGRFPCGLTVVWK